MKTEEALPYLQIFTDSKLQSKILYRYLGKLCNKDERLNDIYISVLGWNTYVKQLLESLWQCQDAVRLAGGAGMAGEASSHPHM